MYLFSGRPKPPMFPSRSQDLSGFVTAAACRSGTRWKPHLLIHWTKISVPQQAARGCSECQSCGEPELRSPEKAPPCSTSWQVQGLFSGLGADVSCRQWLCESHGAGSPAGMSVHLGKCLFFLSAVQEVCVLLNKVSVPYANECPLERWYTDTLYVKYVCPLKTEARTKNHL